MFSLSQCGVEMVYPAQIPPLGGFCTKGVYEYCRPVVRNAEVLAVIFVENILTDSEQQRYRLFQHVDASLLDTMQTHFTEQDCIRTADILESYILFLLDRYGDTTFIPTDGLIENIKSYIAENLLYDFSMKDLSAVFNYNEKYLGRLFKRKTGHTVKEYCNAAKVERAKALLSNYSLRICDVATRAGFNNVTYFNCVFHHITGVSPHAFRERTEHTVLL
jgi:YesN/AraC family two-component response regulator